MENPEGLEDSQLELNQAPEQEGFEDSQLELNEEPTEPNGGVA